MPSPSSPEDHPVWEPDRISTADIRYEAEPRSETKGRRGVDPWALILGILGGVLLGTGVTFAVLGFTGVLTEPEPDSIPPPPALTVPPATSLPVTDPVEAGRITGIAASAIRSVVAVDVSGLFGRGGGSGVVYSDTGYILTNHHVIENADTITVTFADGGRFPADLVGSDPLTDVAVLLVSRADLNAIPILLDEGASIGQPAIAVGNPLSLEGGPSVTSGIVSALDRAIRIDSGTTLYGLVQTDAPITRGSSGGALLDSSGRLIGITTAIAVSDVGAEGLGFAIPTDLVIGVANDLIADGVVDHAFLGINGTTVNASDNGAAYPVGVGVSDMRGESAYELAGGQINDVIVEIAGTRITTLDGLLTLLRRLRAGDEVAVVYLRGENEATLLVTLGRLVP